MNDNLAILEEHIERIRGSNNAVSNGESSSHLYHLIGLKSVWKMLLATITCPFFGNQSSRVSLSILAKHTHFPAATTEMAHMEVVAQEPQNSALKNYLFTPNMVCLYI